MPNLQVPKRRKSWVRCYSPATRSARVWRAIGTASFTANTPSKPNIGTRAVSTWQPIPVRPWSSGWTLSVWQPSCKIPRVSQPTTRENQTSSDNVCLHLRNPFPSSFSFLLSWQIRVESKSVGRFHQRRVRPQRKSSFVQGRPGEGSRLVVRLDGARSASDRCVLSSYDSTVACSV